ncbi:hypothetical protein [Streptomyces tsukubensis]|uniref:Uncharacterized protein n=1 Tax=Streptomyces tsukubensis TaxID=83656 RepID=A0A1V4A278_9ACTN|nr:hypothetical protein [Streptomyces tsukubensis]OON72606.1 hypothetical protein B1H18_28925 [Streptomyces tsukubensis]QFR93896.1 hypothetical protein GBW32_13475 [Streptomyces tsukubensis]
MTFDRLVCANCAGPVSEGRCSVCRASRARMEEREGPLANISPRALIAAIAVLIALLAVLAAHQTS